MKSSKIFLSILAALAAGTLIGIIVAPEKGSTTRKNIVGKGEDYLDELKDKYEGILEVINKKVQSSWNEAEELVAKNKPNLEDHKNINL